MSDAEKYAKRLTKGSGMIFGALVISGITGLGLRMFLTRTFTLSDYGLLYLVFSWISFFTIFRDLGLNSALSRFIPEFMAKNEFGRIKSLILLVTGIQVLVTLPVAIFLMVFSDQIAVVMTGTASASFIIKIFTMWFFLMLFFHVFRSAFQGFQDHVPYSAMEILYITLTFCSVFIFVVWLGMGINGAALGYLSAVPILITVWLVLFYKRHKNVFKAAPLFEREVTSRVLRYSLFIFIGGLGGVVLGYMDTIMIGMFRTTAEVGLYQAAQPITALISYFPAALGIVLLPMISEIWAKNRRETLSRALHSILKFSSLIIVPAVFVLIAFPDVALRSLFGSEYVLASVALQILTFALVLNTLLAVLQQVAAGIEQPMLTTLTVLCMSSMNLVGNLILIPPYGIVGAAVTTLASLIFGLALLSLLLRKFVKFAIPVVPILKMLIAGIFTTATIMFMKSVININPWWLEALVIVPPSLILYCVIVLTTKVLSPKDLVLLGKVVPLPGKIFRIMERMAGK
ncbi:MAG: oligosaccharide flippase family protein [Candidatus Hadarchaeales archaeon]